MLKGFDRPRLGTRRAIERRVLWPQEQGRMKNSGKPATRSSECDGTLGHDEGKAACATRSATDPHGNKNRSPGMARPRDLFPRKQQ